MWKWKEPEGRPWHLSLVRAWPRASVSCPGIGEVVQDSLTFFLHNFHRLLTVSCPGHSARWGTTWCLFLKCTPWEKQAERNGTETPRTYLLKCIFWGSVYVCLVYIYCKEWVCTLPVMNALSVFIHQRPKEAYTEAALGNCLFHTFVCQS